MNKDNQEDLGNIDQLSDNTSKPSRPLFKLIPNKKLLSIILLALLTVSVFVGSYLAQQSQDARSSARQLKTIKEDQISDSAKKILVLSYDPLISSASNQKLSEYMGWRDSLEITNNVIADIENSSGNYVDYVVESYVTLNEFPVKEDGFVYTETSYLNCLSNPSSCHNPDAVDYQKIIDDNGICDMVNNGQINEVWLWGGPWFGYYESRLAGPGAFWYNSPPLQGTSCNRLLPIMGLNYERNEAEALHSYGHRFESAMVQVMGNWNNQNPESDWDFFTLIDSHPVDPSACGNVHFPPNGSFDYDYSNQALVESSCEAWLSYPVISDITESFNCNKWGCSQRGYLNWWLSHAPKVEGFYGRTLGNWWKYVIDYDSAKLEEANYVKKFSITSTANDVNSGCSFEPSKNEIYIGLDPNCSGNIFYSAGLRFESVELERNSTINSASLILNADGPYTQPVTVTIAADGLANPLAFSSTHQPNSVLLTQAITTWEITDDWPYNAKIRSTDITPIIQELINKSDWQSGNSINIILSSSNSNYHRRFFAFERDQNNTATLEIITNVSPIPSPTPTPNPTELSCINSGGTWKTFNNSCADLCISSDSERLCTYDIKFESCDCGQGCFDGTNCSYTRPIKRR